LSDSSSHPAFARLLATPAKVNLGLKIVGRRPDGYHDILTVMEPISLADNLYCEFHPGPTDRCTLACPRLPEVAAADNLVVKAAVRMVELARERVGGPAGHWHFSLDKKIPSGAGLGGGSSNAAAVITLLERFYGLGLSPAERVEIAASLGADIPFFLAPGLARVEGIGERITRLGCGPVRWYLLVKPDFGVDTGWAYGALRAGAQRRNPDYDGGQFTGCGPAAYRLENDFEAPVFARFPRLADIKAWLAGRPDCRGALMSGSGAVVYGIFDSFAAACREYENTRRQWSGEGCMVFLARNLRSPDRALSPGPK
jgi:4-diphosphocytidyl-2-C-methyl-D-erythritol kinase